ncbi:MAG: endonuclease [Planctomycetes bacterium]|nr:endonuclease [Planctomycetota bacterium]
MRLALLATLAVPALLPCQGPPGYYASVNATNPTSLRATLHAVIDDHTKITYTGSGTDTWTVLELADQNPANSSQILDLYKNTGFAKQGGGNSFYNREHSWPNSYGFPNDGAANYPYTDCHHLFLCDIAYNADRANLPFKNGTASWTERTTAVNGGQGGGSGTFPGNSNWFSTSSDGWQTWSGRKGDVARAMFYMDIRYEGGTHGITGAAEPDLRLTDNASLIQTTGGNASIAYMGLLATLVQWHQQDPVDAKEIARNDVIYGFQGNRNPFIDHPEWVACLYSNQCVRVREPEVWINELHYDNTGTDVGEFVEIAGPAGERLNDWMLVAYDGTTGLWYAMVRLGGTIPNQQAGYGTLSFSFANLQNGPADALALVTPSGAVMQFLSWEGGTTASGGAANGKSSLDIGVSEAGTEPVGRSLQLGGSGNSYGQFNWQNPLVATPGAINANQTFL